MESWWIAGDSDSDKVSVTAAAATTANGRVVAGVAAMVPSELRG